MQIINLDMARLLITRYQYYTIQLQRQALAPDLIFDKNYHILY